MTSQTAPLITAIMPVYNGGDALVQAVGSVLAQTQTDFELIVVDDCSTDNCCGFLDRLADPRVKVVRNHSNLGAAASRNRAIGLAAGQYVAIVDADDISLPHRFSTQTAFLKAHPDVDLVAGGSQPFNGHRPLGRSTHPISSHAGLSLGLRYGSSIVHSTVMIRRATLRDVGGYRTEFEPAEDYDMYYRLLIRGRRFSALTDVVLMYRVHELGISKTRAEEGTASARQTRAAIREEAEFPSFFDLVAATRHESITQLPGPRLRLLKRLLRMAMSNPPSAAHVRIKFGLASLAAGPRTWLQLASERISRQGPTESHR
jgi:glycosyltransferase involved in cell wall biosynthesis